jgi:hypothetical protein
VPYSLHLVDDGFLHAQKPYHPDLSGSTRFFIFLGGGSRVCGLTKTAGNFSGYPLRGTRLYKEGE